MPKSLARWNNRETYLYVEGERYHGMVTRSLIDRTFIDGQAHDTYLYNFKTDDGKTFTISAGSVRAKGSALEIKQYKTFSPCDSCIFRRRNIA